MKEKKLWVCEKCGKEFEKYNDCENHEFECMDKKNLYEQNIKNVISKAKQEFGSLIVETKYDINDNSFVCEGNFINCYHFMIEFNLSNGNTVIINDGMDEDLWLGNYLEEDVIYKSTKREIEKHIPISFEGVLNWQNYDDGWKYGCLDDIQLDDIINRLCGRKVKIEVIE